MPIQMKRSAVAGKVPTTAQLSLGELAVNTRDGKLYLKTDDGAGNVAIVEIRNWTDVFAALNGKADITGATGALQLPVGTQAERPDPPVIGQLRTIDEESGQFMPEIFLDNDWNEIIMAFRGQRLRNKILEGPTRVEANTVTWGGAVTLDPGDGLLLDVTLTADVTLTDGLEVGDHMVLEIDDGADFQLTFPPGVIWRSGQGAAPVLQSFDRTIISVWKSPVGLQAHATNGA